MRPFFSSFVRRGLAALCAAAAFALAVSAWSVEQGCADKAPPPSSPQPIVVGVSLGLTGDLDTFAAPLRTAIRAAEGQINAGGGLLGRPLKFDVLDDKGDESDFVKGVAQTLIDKRVVAVIGPIGSQQVVLTQKLYADSQILQISPSATSVDLTTIQPSADRWLYRTTPADDFQGAAVILLAQRTPKGLGDGGAPLTDGGTPLTCSKLAIVNMDNAYGNSMGDVIETNFPKRGPGRTIAIRKKVPKDPAPDYVQVAQEVIGTQPECLAVISYEQIAAQFIKDFKANPAFATLSPEFFFIGTDGVFTAGFLAKSLKDPSDEKSPSSAEKQVFGTNPDTQPGTKEYNEFKTIFASYQPLKGAADAPAFTANAFDAAILIAFAIQAAKDPTNHAAVRDALRKVAGPPGRPFSPAQIGEALQAIREDQDIDYKGASGNVDFQANGNVSAGFIVWEAYRNPTSQKVEYRTVARFGTDELLDAVK